MCIRDSAKITLNIQTYTDPATKKTTTTTPDGYNADADDDVHSCTDVKPFVTISKQHLGGQNYRIRASVSQGTFPLTSVSISLDGQVISTQAISSAGDYTVDRSLSAGSHTISATVVDQAL